MLEVEGLGMAAVGEPESHSSSSSRGGGLLRASRRGNLLRRSRSARATPARTSCASLSLESFARTSANGDCRFAVCTGAFLRFLAYGSLGSYGCILISPY